MKKTKTVAHVIALAALVLPLAQTAKATTTTTPAPTTSSVTQSSSGISYRFKFKVDSLGRDLYACNAGLMAKKELVCTDITGKIVPDPGSCATAKEHCNTGITCRYESGTKGGSLLTAAAGTYNWDPASVLYKDVSVDSNPSLAGYESIVKDTEAFNTRIKDLIFTLRNPTFNAKYFVDICYRGDDVSSNDTVKTQVVALNAILTGKPGKDGDRTNVILIDNNGTEMKYTDVAGLKVQSFIVCDDMVAAQSSSSSLGGLISSSISSTGSVLTSSSGGSGGSVIASSGETCHAGYKYDDKDEVKGGETEHYTSSYKEDMSGDEKHLAEYTAASLKYCKVRYVIEETSDKARPAKRIGAEVCTFTTVEKN